MPSRSNDPLRRAARKAKTQRRVGQDAACTRCGEGRAEMLVRPSRPKLCLTCYVRHNGKRATEHHHLVGRANSHITVEVPITDHRLLSEAQYEWPPETLQNPDGSPLRAIAASLRGLADFICELITPLISRLAESTEKVDDWLRERYGLTTVVAALLAACGGSQPPIGSPGAMAQSPAMATHAERSGSWMLPEASGEDLLLRPSRT